jgi:hypothetical protein
MQISRSKPDSLHRTPAGFTALALDGYGLCDILPARPTSAASYPVSVRRVATLLYASFRQSLAVLPLRFASASPPSGCTGDLHPQNRRTCPTHRTLPAGCRRSPSAILAPARRCGHWWRQVGTKQRSLGSNKATDVGAAALPVGSRPRPYAAACHCTGRGQAVNAAQRCCELT